MGQKYYHDLHLKHEMNTGEFHDREMTCPHCKLTLLVSSPMNTILMAWRICPHCDEEFLIVNDVPMTKAEYDRSQKPC